MAPEGKKRIGKVSNVFYSNGWVARENGEFFIYYASSDTGRHIATTTVEKMIDYVMNTPVDQRIELIDKNIRLTKT